MRLGSYNRRNIAVTSIIFIGILIFLILRLGYLMIYKAEYYSEKAQSLHERERSIKTPRGKIYDRNGNVLADNEAVCTISVVHSQITDSKKVVDTLCYYLGMKEEEVQEKVEKNSSRELIKSNVEKKTADEIRQKEVDGIKVDEDYKRYYPYGSLASKVIGFSGGDNQGILGLEAKYEEVLSGTDGSINTVTDATGIELENEAESRKDPIPGKSLVTTLDLTIQKYAYQAAQKVLQEKNANRVCIIVMNPKNGEIYAMVDAPEYDLNNPFEINGKAMGNSKEDMDSLNNMWRNFNISDTYEPGSIFKVVIASAALETKSVALDDTFYCPGYRVVEGRRIRCAKTTGHGSEDFRHAIMNSCNPAFIDIGAKVGTQKLYDYMETVGLMGKTGIDLPGEAGSIMHDEDAVGPVELATMSFGQSFQISPIMLLTTAATVVNGGNKITPHLGLKVVDEETKIAETLEYNTKNGVISEETSSTMRELLEAVVEEGGGNKAYIEGYRIGGKTATSEKLPRGNGRYFSAFMGFAPADNPQVMTIVLIDEPEGVYYGGTIAAPVVKSIYENILPYLGIMPDKVEQ